MSIDSDGSNPVVRAMQVLLFGTGYNFYNKGNMARADDLLIRQQAGARLSDAAHSLQILETDYRTAFIPRSTRDQPFPPADAMEKLRSIERLRQKISGIEGDIRGMPAPAQDKFWMRLRDELDLLNRLIYLDSQLIEQTSSIAKTVAGWTAQRWHDSDLGGEVAPALQELVAAIGYRGQLLSQPLR